MFSRKPVALAVTLGARCFHVRFMRLTVAAGMSAARTPYAWALPYTRTVPRQHCDATAI